MSPNFKRGVSILSLPSNRSSSKEDVLFDQTIGHIQEILLSEFRESVVLFVILRLLPWRHMLVKKIVLHTTAKINMQVSSS